MYKYKLLSQDERDEMLAQTLQAQERDLFLHNINKERFLAMIPTLPEASEFRQKLEKEIPVIDSRIVEVEAVIKALEPQLPDQARLTSAIVRTEAKQEAQK